MQLAIDYLQNLNLGENERYIIGITGPPGSGKSFIAEKIKTALNDVAKTRYVEILHMDGFHMSDQELKKNNLFEIKGCPETFNKTDFLNKLQELNFVKDQIVMAPTFNRQKEKVQEDNLTIEPNHSLIIVEGNYLLLQDDVWSQVAHFINEIWYIDIDLVTIIPRLLARHEAKDLGIEWAQNKVDNTDIPNAKLIDSTKHLANKILLWENSDLYIK